MREHGSLPASLMTDELAIVRSSSCLLTFHRVCEFWLPTKEVSAAAAATFVASQ